MAIVAAATGADGVEGGAPGVGDVAVVLLLAASLFLGLAHIAILPPFEGFDETAHLSSIRQIAGMRSPPRLGRSFLDRRIEGYQRIGPRPYASVQPFDDNGGITYARFAREGDANRVRQVLSERARFEPGSVPNWQAQHPPLFYLLMAALAGWLPLSLGAQLLAMRLISYLLAWSALVLATLANRRLSAVTALATAAWPFLFPMWFPEMARLGNDSLLALFTSWTWLRVLRWEAGARRPGDALQLGVVAGLGCMTKSVFVPVAAGLGGLILWRRPRERRLQVFASFVLPAVMVGLPWYLWASEGGLLGLAGTRLQAQPGGLLGGLHEHWSVLSFLHSALTVVKSFLWGGTWSLARPPLWFYALLLPAAATLPAGALMAARQKASPVRLALLLVLPVLVGLLFHAFVWMAIGGSAGIMPGWYLHALVAPLAVIMGAAWRWLAQRRAGLVALGFTATTAAFFGAVVGVLQVGLFAGLVLKARSSPVFALPADLGRELALRGAARLGDLAYPATAAVLVAAGALLAVTAALAASQTLSSAQRAPLDWKRDDF